MDIYNPEYVKQIVTYTPQNIPKIIHQIWINESNNPEIPDKWKNSPIQWKRTHPDYIYILWDKESSRNFISTYFSEYLKIYDELSHVIHRCDMIRFAFLYLYGGFYSDLDNYPIKTLEDEFVFGHDVYFPKIKVFYSIYSVNINLIFSKSGCELFLDLLNNIRENYQNNFINIVFAVKTLSGVDVIKSAITNKKYNIGLLPYSKFSPYSLTDDPTVNNKSTALINFDTGNSWYNESMNFSVFIIKYFMEILIIIIITTVIIVIIICYYHGYFDSKIIEKSK